MSYTQRKSVEEPEGQYGHRTRPPAARLKVMIFAIFAVALLALSFHGTLDDFANKQLTATTNESIGILAVAGATNAAISAFQTSQLKVPFLASIEVGQLLDPVNDAVERLSSVMVWAIGSLFLQRILLEIPSPLPSSSPPPPLPYIHQPHTCTPGAVQGSLYPLRTLWLHLCPSAHSALPPRGLPVPRHQQNTSLTLPKVRRFVSQSCDHHPITFLQFGHMYLFSSTLLSPSFPLFPSFSFCSFPLLLPSSPPTQEVCL